jgi:CRP-like cAMP-binding protein
VDDYEAWHLQSAGDSPWSDDVIGLELDRELDRIALRSGAKLQRRRLGRGETLVEQGEAGCDMFLVVDGVLDVDVDGQIVAQVGSGALLGERAVLGDGRRTATLRAVRASRVAILTEATISDSLLPQLVAARRADQG